MRKVLRLAVLFCVAISAEVRAADGPQIVISRFPAGIVRVVNAAASADFIVANVGNAAARVRLFPSASSFTVAPDTFALDPGTNRRIIITPVVNTIGSYQASINLFVEGVTQPIAIPVRMLVTAVPAGGTASVFFDRTGLELIGDQGQRRSGLLTLSNIGNIGTDGLPGAEVPWLIPRSASIHLDAGGRGTFAFDVEPAFRPDRTSPLGAVVGNVTYLWPQANQPPGRLTVAVTDISKVALVPQQASPLGAGEVAAFISGLFGGGTFLVTDLFFSNRNAEGSLSDVKLFYSLAGSSTSLLAALPQLPASTSAWFPDAPRTLFTTTGLGTLQVRTAQLASMSVSATRASFPDQNRYLTALPVLTSDRAVGPNDRIIFSGVEKSDSAHTDIHLQESAGFAGSYTIDFFDAAGTVIPPNRTGSLLPFGYVNLTDVVPPGARAARVTNTSSGAARVNGYAAVVDAFTGDWWIITDPSRPARGLTDLALPVLPGTLNVYVTNASNAAAQIRVGTKSASARRRAVGSGSVSGPDDSITLAPLETRSFPIQNSTDGYIRITGPGGVISATGRLTRTAAGRLGAFGTGVPALPVASSAGIGEVRRFSRANDVPNVSSPTLVLLETAQSAATVRVTARFNFPAGSSVSGQASASKDYEVAAGKLLRITDIARALLGAQRDTLGELWNLNVDTEVVAGQGRVLSYLQSIDRFDDLTLSVD